MWILRSTDELKPYTLRLSQGAKKTLGRGLRSDFVVDATLVSKIHCYLSAASNKLVVEDLSSTNGTFVNEHRIKKSQLRVGDKLRLGQIELSVSKE